MWNISIIFVFISKSPWDVSHLIFSVLKQRSPTPRKKKRLEAAVLKNEKGLLIIIAYFIYVDDWLRLPILKKTLFIIVSDNKGAM